MLEIVKYINKFGLDKTLDDFKLKSKEYDKKVLIKYNQIESPMGERVVQEARGIVLEKDTWKVLSLGFFKFFNHGESHAAKIDWDSAVVLEKLDGTLITLYWDWNKKTWFPATTGTAEGEGEVNNKIGTTFNDLFWDTVKYKYNFDTNKLNKDNIYMFELTTPYNIVVKPHGESSSTLLAVRDRNSLKEYPYSEILKIGSELNVPVVKSYDLNNGNVKDILKTFENMVWHDEGYVVVDGNFNRIKIKNPAYVSAHHLKGKMANHHIMGIIKNNECDEFISTFPDRKDEIIRLNDNYNELISKLEKVWGELEMYLPKINNKKEKKKYAMKVFEITNKFDLSNFTGLYFSLANGRVDNIKEYMLDYDNKKLYNML